MGKRFNFWRDVVSPTEALAGRAAKSLAPVTKPIVGALTKQAVGAIGKIGQAAPAAAALSMKKGGLVKPKGGKKTQKATLHSGELVVPKHLVSKVPKSVKDKIKQGGGHNM